MQSFVVHWGYLALFLLTALSAFCIPVGSELAMAYAGAVASGSVLAGTHHFTLGAVIAVAVAGELFGSACGYALGRFGGRAAIDRAGRYLLLSHRDLDRVEAFMTRRGEPFVFVGRLIPLLRSFVAVVAGLAEMTFWRFLLFSLAGSAVFTAALCSAGYALGSSWHKVVKDFSDAGYVALALAVIAIAVGIAHRLKVVRAERAELPTSPAER
jgi:membrane protein DedA with SNARE-associated domain